MICVFFSSILLVHTVKNVMNLSTIMKEPMINQSFEYEHSIEDVSGAIDNFVVDANIDITNIESNFDDIIEDISDNFMS